MTDKNIRDELAELTEAVRDLRDREVAAELAGLRAEVGKLRAERDGHACHGHHCCSGVHCNWGHCGCWVIHGHYQFGGTVTYPHSYTVTCGSTGTVTATNGYLNTTGTNTLSIN